MTLLNVSIDELHGFEPSVNLVQFLSNVTGAFIEPWEERKVGLTPDQSETDDLKYRISSMNPLKAELALRLLHVASLRVSPHSKSQHMLTASSPISFHPFEAQPCSPLLLETQSPPFPYSHSSHLHLPSFRGTF